MHDPAAWLEARAAPAAGPLAPEDVVACPPYGARVRVALCLDRRAARTPSGGGRGAPIFPVCQACPFGAGHAARAPAYVPRRYAIPRAMLPNAQRAARARLLRVGAWGRWVPTMDDGPRRDG